MEVMIAFKGRSSMKQYTPKKPTKRGFKVWMRADSNSGYVFQLECYTGKQGSTTEVGLGGNVVTCLTWDLVGQHYCVYTWTISLAAYHCFRGSLMTASMQQGHCTPTGSCSPTILCLRRGKDCHHGVTWSSGRMGTQS